MKQMEESARGQMRSELLPLELREKLGEEKIEECRKAFLLFDMDGSGAISAAELANCLRSLGQNPTNDQIRVLIEEVDVDGSGDLDFVEFMGILVNSFKKFGGKEVEKGMLREAFDVLDSDGSGNITFQEFKHVCQTIGDVLSDEEIHEFLTLIDADGDGIINFDEFMSLTVSDTLVDLECLGPDADQAGPSGTGAGGGITGGKLDGGEGAGSLLAAAMMEASGEGPPDGGPPTIAPPHAAPPAAAPAPPE